jgi:hypothetical protein
MRLARKAVLLPLRDIDCLAFLDAGDKFREAKDNIFDVLCGSDPTAVAI